MRIDNPTLKHPAGRIVPALLKSSIITAAVSRVEFTLPQDFTFFILHIRNVRLSADDNGMNLRVSTDGGVSFASGASDYAWNGFRNGTGGVVNVQDSADTEISLVGGTPVIGNATGEGFNAIVYMLNPGQDNNSRFMTNASSSWNAGGASGGNLNNSEIGGRYAQNGTVNAISVGTNTVNLVSGQFDLYGIK